MLHTFLPSSSVTTLFPLRIAAIRYSLSSCSMSDTLYLPAAAPAVSCVVLAAAVVALLLPLLCSRYMEKSNAREGGSHPPRLVFPFVRLLWSSTWGHA